MAFDNADFQLYTFFRSTSTARVRIAARIKGIPLSFIYINVRQDEQHAEAFSHLNPNRTVPVLTVTRRNDENSSPSFSIRQSVSILEFFEEAFPDKTPLLPPTTDLSARAHVRDLVSIICADLQPPTNRRILLRVQDQGGSPQTWAHNIMRDGLLAFEETAKPLAGKYSFGDSLTLADVVLAPAVENAVRYGVNLEMVPTVKRVFEAIRDLPEFRAADWRHQGDTPADEVTV